MATDDTTDPVRQVFRPDERDPGALRQVAGLLGRKWHLTVLYHLSLSGGLRFSRLEERIDGISGKMLAESLDALETQYGVVERTTVSDNPLKVEYSLSERGESLEPIVSAIARWTRENRSVLDE
jgi:DNA-binding HxlR family transcriptional regulator